METKPFILSALAGIVAGAIIIGIGEYQRTQYLDIQELQSQGCQIGAPAE